MSIKLRSPKMSYVQWDCLLFACIYVPVMNGEEGFGYKARVLSGKESSALNHIRSAMLPIETGYNELAEAENERLEKELFGDRLSIIRSELKDLDVGLSLISEEEKIKRSQVRESLTIELSSKSEEVQEKLSKSEALKEYQEKELSFDEFTVNDWRFFKNCVDNFSIQTTQAKSKLFGEVYEIVSELELPGAIPNEQE